MDLPSNVALAVNPDSTYAKVRERRYFWSRTGQRSWDDEIVEEMPGKSLEHLEYEQLLPFAEVGKKAFYVTVADFVSTEDGTG